MPKDQSANLEKLRVLRARQQAIGRELQRMYESVIQEPVPDEFLELLKKMDAAEKNPPEENPS